MFKARFNRLNVDIMFNSELLLDLVIFNIRVIFTILSEANESYLRIFIMIFMSHKFRHTQNYCSI